MKSKKSNKNEYFPAPDLTKHRRVAVNKDKHFGYWDV